MLSLTQMSRSYGFSPSHSNSIKYSAFGFIVSFFATGLINNPTDDGNRNVWDLAWHPQGHILASVGHDMTLKVWSRSKPGDAVKLSQGQQLHELTPQQLALRAAQQKKKQEQLEQQGLDPNKQAMNEKKVDIDFKAGLLHDGSHLPTFNANKKKHSTGAALSAMVEKGGGNEASRLLNTIYKRKKIFYRGCRCF